LKNQRDVNVHYVRVDRKEEEEEEKIKYLLTGLKNSFPLSDRVIAMLFIYLQI
jgi:hypothetical protein